jgi:hypothetical protein
MKGEKHLKIIQTQNDIEFLRANNDFPMAFINTIAQEFHQLMAEIGPDEEPLSFVLPIRLAIILFESGDDVLGIVGNGLQLEYIEKIVEEPIEFYRIAKRHDHELQLMYSFVGIHKPEIEKWLGENAE